MEKKKALLVYPKIPETYWSFKHALRIQGKHSAFPPLGALTVAGMFPKDEWEVKLVDQNVHKLKDKDIINSDAVFISAMAVQKKSVEEDIKRAKKYLKKTVLGGPITSTNQPETELVDYLVEGEAESIFSEVLEDLVKGTTKKHYKSLDLPDLSSTPKPRFELINPKDYSSMLLQYGRGCPFNCKFCHVTEIYGRIPRAKPLENFMSEFNQLYEIGWKGSVFIGDDNLIGNIPKAKQLMIELEKWQQEKNYPFSLFTQASVNLSQNEELLEGMRKAGFKKVFLGLETPVQASLSETGKKQNLNLDLEKAVEKIERKGIEVMGGFIIGFDNDPENIFQLQKEFIDKTSIPLAMVGLLSAIPGTELYRELESQGRIIHGASGDNTDGSLNFIPILEKEKLISGYKALMNKLYSSKEYYSRALSFF